MVSIFSLVLNSELSTGLLFVSEYENLPKKQKGKQRE